MCVMKRSPKPKDPKLDATLGVDGILFGKGSEAESWQCYFYKLVNTVLTFTALIWIARPLASGCCLAVVLPVSPVRIPCSRVAIIVVRHGDNKPALAK